MRHFLCFLFLFVSVSVMAQNQVKKHNGKPVLIRDSLVGKKLQEINDSKIVFTPPVDSNEIRDEMSRNIDTILDFQKERRAREKKAAIIRIAIGIGFLVLLLIGLNRRKRMKV